MPLILPDNYSSCLSYRDTQRAIKLTREAFERKLLRALNLERVSAPLFVSEGEGINDDLNGVERAVDFDILHIPGKNAQIVHSLAKWKRLGLRNYGFGVGEGLYTNMNAIRRDEDMDNIHSIYVDQWDWEKVISREQRNVDYLCATVKSIVGAIIDTLDDVKAAFPTVTLCLNRNVTFITSQNLEDLYPNLSPKDREREICKQCGTVFIMQIGDKLKSGSPHDGRAPDYDDWQLNGDILFYNEILDIPFEISSMGIRVDEKSLGEQLVKAGCPERSSLYYHRQLLDGKLPLSIGGGIGQSRLCMLLLQKAHIGEVHASIWPQEMLTTCLSHNIKIL